VAYIIAEPCVGTKDTACVDVCPVDCIHPAKGRSYDDGRPTFDEVPQLYIDPTECIDCGACVPVCPVTAIFPLRISRKNGAPTPRSTQVTSLAASFSQTNFR
jgi:ferredoxin